MLWFSLKLAFRNILKNKQSYLLNVIGLIIALTVCFITLFFVVFEHNYEKYRFTAKNVFIVKEKDKTWDMFYIEDLPLGLSHHLLHNTPGVKTVINYCESSDFNIQIGKDKIFKEWTFHFVDTSYMKYMNKTMLAGNCLLKNPGDLLLTRKIALKYFGTVNCIGKEITVYDNQDKTFHFTVSGVFDYPAPRNFHPDYNLIARLDIYGKLRPDFKDGDEKTKTYAYLILDEKANHKNILQNIQNYYTQHVDKDYFKNKSIQLITPKQRYFEYAGKKVNTAIFISIIILLVAFINFIIHNNAQFWERCKTIGISKIAGGGPKHAFSQSFTEIAIINILCVVVAFYLAISILPLVKRYLNESISIDILPLYGIFFLGLAVALLISLLTSLSSLYLSTRQPIQLVSRKLNRGVRGKLVNSTLITLQVGVTTFLLIMFFSTTQQLKYVQHMNWGFDAEQVMYINLNESISHERFNELRERIQQTQGVVSLSGCWHFPPASDKFFYGYLDANGNKIMIDKNEVDYPFLKLLGIKLQSGRDFDRNIDIPGQKIIVNQELLDVKGIQNPYDTLVKVDDRFAAKQIIGVIDKYHMRGMYEKIPPQIIELNPNESRNLLVKISANHVMKTLDEIKDEFHKVFPNITYKMGFVQDDIQHLYQEQRDFSTVISYCTIISLIIATMGLFAFTMNEVNKRIKEVGIRKVNGAKTIELFTLLNQEFVQLSLIGFLISSPLAWHFSQKWSENFAYKTDTTWWVFLLVAILVFFIVFATVSIQTIKVARRNPVESLRYE